jgi:hypothetical protein
MLCPTLDFNQFLNQEKDHHVFTDADTAGRIKIAEQVLPYARYLAKALAIPVELLEAVDPEALQLLTNRAHGRYLDTLLADKKESSGHYLDTRLSAS